MNTPGRSQTEEWRMELDRAIKEFHRRASKLFDSGEDHFCVLNPNGLGVWVGVKSLRATARLETVHRLVFGKFAPEARYTDNTGIEWLHFGFFYPSKRPEKIGEFVCFVDAA